MGYTAVSLFQQVTGSIISPASIIGNYTGRINFIAYPVEHYHRNAFINEFSQMGAFLGFIGNRNDQTIYSARCQQVDIDYLSFIFFMTLEDHHMITHIIGYIFNTRNYGRTKIIGYLRNNYAYYFTSFFF